MADSTSLVISAKTGCVSPRRDSDPSFYLRPAPAGRSRESSIRLDAHGQFWHDDERVKHPRLAAAFADWIQRHPENGRFILSNGYDWTYLEVEATALFVVGLQETARGLLLRVSNGKQLALVPSCLVVDPDGVLRLSQQGPSGDVSGLAEDARFSNPAQLGLAHLLEDRNGHIYLALRNGSAPVELMPASGETFSGPRTAVQEREG